jgi:hypothetical protein
MRNGNGKYYNGKQQIEYEGEWENDEFNGKGKLTLKN